MFVQGYQVDAARSLAYLLNANFTLSGGCPNPPPTAFFTDQVRLNPCPVNHSHSCVSLSGLLLYILSRASCSSAQAAAASSMLVSEMHWPLSQPCVTIVSRIRMEITNLSLVAFLLTRCGCAQLGDAIVRAVALGRNTSDPTPQPLTLTGNLTDTQVANALIAGITLAAKSCGPPNHLSSSRWGFLYISYCLLSGLCCRLASQRAFTCHVQTRCALAMHHKWTC